MPTPTSAERARVRAAIEEWQQVETLDSTTELHLFAHDWNWDDVATPLFGIIRHPHCDKGTALYLFWLSDPIYFFETFANADEAQTRGEYETGYYRLLVEIQESYRRSFYTSETIAINPELIANEALSSDHLKTPLLAIMLQPSPGTEWPNWSAWDESD